MKGEVSIGAIADAAALWGAAAGMLSAALVRKLCPRSETRRVESPYNGEGGGWRSWFLRVVVREVLRRFDRTERWHHNVGLSAKILGCVVVLD